MPTICTQFVNVNFTIFALLALTVIVLCLEKSTVIQIRHKKLEYYYNQPQNVKALYKSTVNNPQKYGRRYRSRRWLFSQQEQNQQQNSEKSEYENPPQPQTQPKTAADDLQQPLRHSHHHQQSSPSTGGYGSNKLVDEELDRQQLEDYHRRIEAKSRKAATRDYGRRRLQGVGVRGRLVCGRTAMNATKVKLVDVDLRPDRDDLMAETRTDAQGHFHLSGATREESDIEVIIKVYHDCLDEHLDCQRKVTWRVPSRYHNNGTLVEWFDIGTVNMELIFGNEERDCRH